MGGEGTDESCVNVDGDPTEGIDDLKAGRDLVDGEGFEAVFERVWKGTEG